jgi:biotin carboxyl carrier protein
MKYIININGRDYEVEYDEAAPAVVRLNGREMSFDLQQGVHPENVSLILDNLSLMFWIEQNEEGYHAHCLGRDFNIVVEDEKTRRARAILKGGAGKSVAGTIKASMPGMIVKVNVEPGQTVQKGEGVVIVEAMKMENEVKSPIDGIVKEIRVSPLQAVEKGETMLTIEPEVPGDQT